MKGRSQVDEENIQTAALLLLCFSSAKHYLYYERDVLLQDQKIPMEIHHRRSDEEVSAYKLKKEKANNKAEFEDPEPLLTCTNREMKFFQTHCSKDSFLKTLTKPIEDYHSPTFFYLKEMILLGGLLVLNSWGREFSSILSMLK